MGEKLSFDEKIKLSREIAELEPLIRASIMLEAAFDSNPTWVEEVPADNDTSVRRLRSVKPDADGDMGYLEEAHLIGVAEVSSGENKTYIVEAFYPFDDKKPRYFYEFEPIGHRLKLSGEQESVEQNSEEFVEHQKNLFPFLCRDVFFNLNFRSVYNYVEQFPFQHPHFRELE